MQWKCPNCVATKRKGGDNSNTPVRADNTSKTARNVTSTSDKILTSESEIPANPMINDPSFIKIFESVLVSKLQNIKHEIVEELKSEIFTDLKNEIVALSSEFSQLQASYCQLQIENDHLKKDMLTLQERVSTSENQFQDLRTQFGRQQQQSRMNNIEIVGLPQTSGESPVDLVLKIAEVAGVELNRGDIDFAHRVQPLTSISGRPKPIVAKLKDRLCKDKLLSGLKSKKSISTKDMCISGIEKRFFVNEHLTPENKQLLKATKIAAKEKAYKFVWVRNCSIFLRKNEEAPAMHIRLEKDLARIK